VPDAAVYEPRVVSPTHSHFVELIARELQSCRVPDARSAREGGIDARRRREKDGDAQEKGMVAREKKKGGKRAVNVRTDREIRGKTE